MNNFEVGKKLKSLRESVSLTQKELGNLLGYTESFISYVEKGLRNLKDDDFKKLESIFNVNARYFYSMPNTHYRADATLQRADDDDTMSKFLEYAKKVISKENGHKNDTTES